jgi:hypothetical protein
MLKISDNIAATIDELDRNHYELALRHICVAIDQTTKKYFEEKLSGRKNYKNFIAQHYWILELMVFEGLDLENCKFGNFPIEDGDKPIKQPSIADIVYHIIRCSLMHGDGVPENIQFTEDKSTHLDKNILRIPKSLIWGLIAIVTFSKCNENEVIDKRFWMSIAGNRLCINDSFGQENLMQNIYNRNIRMGADGKPLKVAIALPEGFSGPLTAHCQSA